jgi:hypothetical protein
VATFITPHTCPEREEGRDVSTAISQIRKLRPSAKQNAQAAQLVRAGSRAQEAPAAECLALCSPGSSLLHTLADSGLIILKAILLPNNQ